MKTYTAVIYYRADGQLTEERRTISAPNAKEARRLGKQAAAEYVWITSNGDTCTGRLVTIEAEKQS
jgi:hypothetical protein